MLHNLTNKQGSYNINGKLASGNKVNVVNAVPKNPKIGKSVVPVKVGGMRSIAKKDHCITIVGDSHSDLIVCGDVNVNYLHESDKKSQLNALLNSYNLFSIVQFPTRTYKKSISAIDNIFIDTTKIDTYEVIPVLNGLSDHDAQIINLNTLYNNKSHGYQSYFRRNINKYTMAEFQNSLSYES